MLSFRQFITEKVETPKKKISGHLDHVSDKAILTGNQGLADTVQYIENLHGMLSGHKRDRQTGKSTHAAVLEKLDGAPGFFFGHQNGKPFVATKSALNVKPKLNFTPKDVDANHPDKPELAKKVKLLLKHLPKILPASEAKNSRVYWGDMLHDSNSLKRKGTRVAYQPNTVEYSHPVDSAEGKKALASKIGVAIHSEVSNIKNDNIASGDHIPLVDDSHFIKHPDVHLINHKVNIDPSHYTAQDRAEYINHHTNARLLYRKMKPDDLDQVSKHNETLQAYIHHNVRTQSEPSADNYIKYLASRSDKEVADYKTPAKQNEVRVKYQKLVDQVNSNKKTFDNAFQLHGHLEKAKDVLLRSLNKTRSETEYRYNGQKIGPEGYVMYKSKGGKYTDPIKLVDRRFSHANFTNGKMQKKDEKHHTLAFIRANPPTAGHEKLINMVTDYAEQGDHEHTIVLSHSHDPRKNPLTLDQKMQYVKKAFPNANFAGASAEMPGLLHWANHLHNQGVTHLHIVGGADRVKKFQETLNIYNGKPGGHGKYNFKAITGVSAGDRDPDADGVEGVSGTKVRAAARNNDWALFKKSTPKGLSDKDKYELMKLVRKQMQGHDNKQKKV